MTYLTLINQSKYPNHYLYYIMSHKEPNDILLIDNLNNISKHEPFNNFKTVIKLIEDKHFLYDSDYYTSFLIKP